MSPKITIFAHTKTTTTFKQLLNNFQSTTLTPFAVPLQYQRGRAVR